MHLPSMLVGNKTQLHMRSRSNRYDHLDRRVQKITPAATHTYFYDGWMLIKDLPGTIGAVCLV